MDYLIVGLGNPGARYQKTRHNLGWMAVQAFAEKQGWKFKQSMRLKGQRAHGIVEDRNVYLFLPGSYMNLSGQPVKSCMNYYKIQLQNLLIAVDDIYVPFGRMRLREKGSAGGHNGLKSVEAHLQTQNYSRLRLGVGQNALPPGGLEEFVLGNFDADETAQLPDLITKAVSILETWVTGGMESAMKMAGELS